MYLDFDRFKLVNDTPRPQGGRRAAGARGAAHARRCCARPTSLARLGGDEFAILVRGPRARARRRRRWPSASRRSCEQPVQLGGDGSHQSAPASASPSAPSATRRPTRSSATPTSRCTRPRAKGKAQYALFDASLHQHVTAQLQLESELRRALGQGQIYLDYQPICTLRDREAHRLRGAGALEPSRARPARAGHVHSGGRGDRASSSRWATGCSTEACRQMREWQRDPRQRATCA